MFTARVTSNRLKCLVITPCRRQLSSHGRRDSEFAAAKPAALLLGDGPSLFWRGTPPLLPQFELFELLDPVDAEALSCSGDVSEPEPLEEAEAKGERATTGWPDGCIVTEFVFRFTTTAC